MHEFQLPVAQSSSYSDGAPASHSNGNNHNKNSSK